MADHARHTARLFQRDAASGTRRRRRVGVLVSTALTSLAMVTAVTTPAHAAGTTTSTDTANVSTRGAYVQLTAKVEQQVYRNSSGYCYGRPELKWNVLNATSTQDANLEAKMRDVAARSSVKVPNEVRDYDEGNTTWSYKHAQVSTSTCPDVTMTDANRRLSTMGTFGRGLAALATGIVVDGAVIAAGVLITSYVPVAAAAAANYPVVWAGMLGCVAGALGTAAAVAVKGLDARSYWAAAVACVTEGSVGAVVGAMKELFVNAGERISLAARNMLAADNASLEMTGGSTIDALSSTMSQIGNS